MQQGRIIVVPREQQYFYYSPYDYNPYQPDNGPMRGPNSIEGHKSKKQHFKDNNF